MSINEQTFKKNSKTFSFAAIFFSKSHYNEISKLYFYLRNLDDFFEGKQSLSAETINEIENIEDYFIGYLKIPEVIFLEFKKAMKIDQNMVSLKTSHELIKYCYGAAGTVGLLLCYILKVPKIAFPHAIDLGIAMQLTNICRDIFEDYKHQKIYLPLISEEMVKTKKQIEIQNIQKTYLLLANKYYSSGFMGVKYLPFRARFAVIVAALLYRRIGTQILKDDDFTQRSYVKTISKFWLSLFVAPFYFFKLTFISSKQHNKTLHHEIQDAPYANA